MRTHLLFTSGHVIEVTVDSPKPGDLRVWWIPQVPGKPFYVYVADIDQALLVTDLLANYDLFQFENRIKPDYNNAGGLQTWDAQESDWVEWYSEEGEDLHERLERLSSYVNNHH